MDKDEAIQAVKRFRKTKTLKRRDVAVIVDKIGDDFLELEAGLYRKRREIDERIKPILVESGNDPSAFFNTVLSTGEIIFKRDDQPQEDGDLLPHIRNTARFAG